MDTRRSGKKRRGKNVTQGSAEAKWAGGASNTTISPVQSTLHALQSDFGLSNQDRGHTGPVKCKQLTIEEQLEARQMAEAEWSRPMIKEVADAIFDRAESCCKKLFEKARWTSLSWEEEWNLVYFKSKIAAEIMAG